MVKKEKEGRAKESEGRDGTRGERGRRKSRGMGECMRVGRDGDNKGRSSVGRRDAKR